MTQYNSQSDADFVEWLERMKKYTNSATIRRPGAWLESDLSDDEIIQGIKSKEVEDSIISSDKKLSDEDQVKALIPYINPYMHILYKGLKNSDVCHVSADDEKGFCLDGDPKDLVLIILCLFSDTQHLGKHYNTTSLLSSPFLPLLNGKPTNELRKKAKAILWKMVLLTRRRLPRQKA